MDEFFDQVKQNLEGREMPAPDPGAWQRMERKLKQAQQRRRVAGWWWFAIAGALILALGAGNVILASQLSGTRKALKSRDQEPVRHTDTVFLERTLVRVDTVYLERPHTPAYNRGALAYRDDTSGSSEQAPSATSRSDAIAEPATSLEEARAKAGIASVVEHSDLTSNPVDREHTEISRLVQLNNRLLALPGRSFPGATASGWRPIVRGRNQSLIDFLRPKAFEAGGYFESNTTFLRDVMAEDGYGVGAEFTLYFNRRWQVWVGYHYMQLRYRALQMGDALDIPVVNAPLEDFTFTETNVTIPAWQINAGMSY
ncbi:MAG: hypothetical protein R3330_11215, partial [Saprospiraceae bacterium]|nr:hypothetical protein [Saprospiraceae bacterium]